MSAAFDVPESFWRCAARLAGCGHWPPGEAQSEAWIAACRRHRLLPLIAASTTFPARHAPAARAAAREDDAAQAASNSAQEATIARLRERLPAEGWVAIKGLDYRCRLYPDPRLRPMNDVDFLLRPEVFETQTRQLPTRGFALRSGGSAREVSLTDRNNGVVVDLYRALAQPQRVAIDYGEVWARAQTLDDGTRVPAPAHALAVHALLMANQQYDTHLRKYLDLWLLARAEAVALEAAEVAARWRMRRAYAASLTMLARIVPEFEDHAGLAAARGQLGRGERRVLDAVLPASPVAAPAPRARVLWRKWHLIDDWSQRLRFGVAHFAGGRS